MTKAELLDRSSSDLPVRMALGEAQVVAQTKQALAEAGPVYVCVWDLDLYRSGSGSVRSEHCHMYY